MDPFLVEPGVESLVSIVVEYVGQYRIPATVPYSVDLMITGGYLLLSTSRGCRVEPTERSQSFTGVTNGASALHTHKIRPLYRTLPSSFRILP